MSRPLCQQCHRPINTCICRFTCAINNAIHVIFLLHPKEVNHSKGTLPLLVNSLKNHTTIEGENFTDNELLNAIINENGEQVALLYPSDDAFKLTSDLTSKLTAEGTKASNKMDSVKIKYLIIIDATWKKAYRMYMLSKNLSAIKHLALADNIIGQYHIRKTSKKNALSTLEACCYALDKLENSPDKYQALLEKFVEFNQFQLSFRPNQ